MMKRNVAAPAFIVTRRNMRMIAGRRNGYATMLKVITGGSLQTMMIAV